MQAKTSSVVAIVAAIIAAMVGFIILTIRGQDPTAFSIFASGVLIPQILTLLRQDKAQQGIEQIQQRTNGPLDRQAETLRQISAKVDDIGKKIEGR